jgi:hypothetical protein
LSAEIWDNFPLFVLPAESQRQCHRGVELSTGDGSEDVNHRRDRKPGDPGSDGKIGFCRRRHDGGKDDSEGAKKLGN